MASTFHRHHLATIATRILEPRNFIQVIFGPRQVGKTTLITQLIPSLNMPHLFVSADGQLNAPVTWVRQQWETARTLSQQNPGKSILLVIDEIQKVAQWSEVIKQLWDEDTRTNRPIKLILLGSSRLLLQKGLTESLAGRFETTYVEHWSYHEMQSAFGWDVNQFIWFGGYPGAASLIANETRWKKYIVDSLIETSINKDIMMLDRIAKPALMNRLFELGCTYSGQILSYNKILGQLQDAGNTTTLAHYLQLLNQTGLLAGIDKFAGDKIRQRGSTPKFQVHNTALISAQSAETLASITASPEQWGRQVESAVGAHLLNYAIMENFKLHYWRSGNFEVDFVIEKNSCVIGIEVKSGIAKNTQGMAVFHKTFNPAKVLLIGQGGIPLETFLLMNPVTLF